MLSETAGAMFGLGTWIVSAFMSITMLFNLLDDENCFGTKPSLFISSITAPLSIGSIENSSKNIHLLEDNYLGDNFEFRKI